jgi:hypothetical protein
VKNALILLIAAVLFAVFAFCFFWFKQTNTTEPLPDTGTIANSSDNQPGTYSFYDSLARRPIEVVGTINNPQQTTNSSVLPTQSEPSPTQTSPQPTQVNTTINTNTDAFTFADYANEAGEAIIYISKEIQGFGEDLIQAATTSPETGTGKAIEKYAQSYITAANILKSVSSVPTDIQKSHTTLLNTFTDISKNITLISKAAEKGSYDQNALIKYNDSVLANARAVVEIGNLLKKVKATLNPGDPGFIFLEITG